MSDGNRSESAQIARHSWKGTPEQLKPLNILQAVYTLHIRLLVLCFIPLESLKFVDGIPTPCSVKWSVLMCQHHLQLLLMAYCERVYAWCEYHAPAHSFILIYVPSMCFSFPFSTRVKPHNVQYSIRGTKSVLYRHMLLWSNFWKAKKVIA